MIVDNRMAWTVKVTFAARTIKDDGSARQWTENTTVTVIADKIDRALAMVKKQWPEATIWSANHVGSRTIILLDAEDAKS